MLIGIMSTVLTFEARYLLCIKIDGFVCGELTHSCVQCAIIVFVVGFSLGLERGSPATVAFAAVTIYASKELLVFETMGAMNL